MAVCSGKLGPAVSLSRLALPARRPGPRYLAVRGGVIETLGGGANVFPGSVAGTAPTGYYN
jgi:hypothetical protein